MKLNSGKILISEPFMLDINFKRTVILLADYHETEGSFGFIINRKTEFQLNDFTDDFPAIEAPVYSGGPVSIDSLYYIHDLGELIDDSVNLGNGLYWGGHYNKLKALVASGLVTPNNIRFFIGYSGWDPGQLEAELEEKSWIVSDLFSNYLFKSDSDTLWKECLENMGKHYGIIGQISEDQIMN